MACYCTGACFKTGFCGARDDIPDFFKSVHENVKTTNLESRIRSLEADNKRLVEIIDRLTKRLESNQNADV